MTEWLHFHFSLSSIGEGNGNPLQCSCLENPRDGGAWWAAVYGVAQSWTQLKWLSSSSSSKALWNQIIFFPLKWLLIKFSLYLGTYECIHHALLTEHYKYLQNPCKKCRKLSLTHNFTGRNNKQVDRRLNKWSLLVMLILLGSTQLLFTTFFPLTKSADQIPS